MPSDRVLSRRLLLDSIRDLEVVEEEEDTFTMPNEGIEDNTDKIFKALRLVPEFDGNCNVLIRFLDICDQLIVKYANSEPGNELNNSALLNGILNKVTGPAARTLATNGIPRDWNGIRATLINTFSDHRDKSALYTDLSILTQGPSSPQVFYERVQNLLSVIMTYVQLHENVPTTVEAKRNLYKKLALQTYTRGLHEPLGSRIRCMRPQSLEQALEFAQEELNVVYLQKKNSHPPHLQRQLSPHFSNAPAPIQFRPYAEPPQMHVRQTPTQGKFAHYNLSPRPPAQGPSRTQEIMRALPRSNMSTGFRIPPRFQAQN